MYLEVQSTPVTGTPCTLAGLALPTNLTADHVVIALADKDGGSENLSLWCGGTTASDPVRAMARAGGTSAGASTSTTYSTSAWNHCCAVFRSATSRDAYLNGGGKGSNTTNRAPTLIDSIQIGRTVGTAGEKHMDGKIAYVALWNTDLSDAEVALLGAGPPYIDPRNIKPGNLVFYRDLIRDLNRPYLGDYTLSSFNSPTVTENPAILMPSRHIFIMKAPLIATAGLPSSTFTALAPTAANASAWSHVQSVFDAATGSATTSSKSVTGIGSGNVLAVLVKHEGAVADIEVSDGTSTFSAGTKTNHANGDLSLQWHYLLSANSGDKTITATFKVSGSAVSRPFRSIIVMELTHAETAAMSAQAGSSGTSVGSGVISSGDLTTSLNNSVVLGGYGEYSNQVTDTERINDTTADAVVRTSSVANFTVAWR